MVRLSKTTKPLSQDSRDENPGPLEYEAGVLTTQPRPTVKHVHILDEKLLIIWNSKAVPFGPPALTLSNTTLCPQGVCMSFVLLSE
jgi:hypothetical protein